MKIHERDDGCKGGFILARCEHERFYCNQANLTEQQQINSDLWTNMKDSVFDQCNLDFLTFNEAVLSKDNSSNELLNNLTTISLVKIRQVYQALGGSMPFPPNPVLISFIRTQANSDVSLQINTYYTQSEIKSALKSCSTSLLEDVTDPSTGSYSLCNLLALLPNCGTGVGNTWFNFVKDYIDTTLIHTIIKNESNQSYLISILLNKTGSEGVVNTNKDAIALALNNSNSTSLTDYLIKINKYLGSWVYQSIIETVGSNIVIKKEITLDELHIYGSSRHGIHKPNLTLVNNTYRINKLDSATDSSQAFLSYSYFKRTLTYKQYELSNHLGNVLATVLDRKTAVTDSTGGDTLMYYVADVYTAGLYYAFGSAINEMQYKSDTGGSYRYGFNGEENEIKLFEGCVTFEARIYDSRIGKFMSTDPREDEYPWQSPYAYYMNSPVSILDINGEGGPYEPETDPDFNLNLGNSSGNSSENTQPKNGNIYSVNSINLSLQGIAEVQTQISLLYTEIESLRYNYDAKVLLRDNHDAGSIVLGPAGWIVSANWTQKEENEFDRIDKEINTKLNELVNQINLYKLYVNSFKYSLSIIDKIDFGNGIIADKSLATQASENIHKNNKSAVGNWALYEIEIDGTHYKFGVANANDKLKTDCSVTDHKGNQHVFKAGTIRRVYVQARAILSVETNVSIKIISTHNSITKGSVLSYETQEIEKGYAKRGWIGDGNTGHARNRRQPGQHNKSYKRTKK